MPDNPMKRMHDEQKGVLPEHLRDDAPFQVCSECERKTWARGQFEMACRMTQPDDTRCTGRFVSADPITKARAETPRPLESYFRSMSVSAEELGLPPRAPAAASSDRLVSEERVRELAEYAANWLHKGAPLDEAQNVVRDAIRTAIREAGEAAAKVCDGYTGWWESPNQIWLEIAAEIRRRLP